MWAFVESMGFGPEEAKCRPWSVYSYTSGSWEEQTGVEVVNLDPPATEEEDNKQGVEFDLVLDLEFSAILNNVDDFKKDVVVDLAAAIGALSGKIRVLGLEAGSVIVHVIFEEDVCGGVRSALDALREIERQVANPVSALRQGRYTSQAKSLRLRESTLRHLQPASRHSHQRQAEAEMVEALGSKVLTPRAPEAPAETSDTAIADKQGLHVLDRNNDGLVDEDEFREYTSSLPMVQYGASRVRISGLVLYNGGSAQPYKGINGDYVRSEEVCNFRAVYVKEDKPGIAMWWANIVGTISWCVGPKDQVGKDGIWAHVESMGFGPEEAGTRAWTVYSYNSGSWEDQTGVEVENLDPSGHEAMEDRDDLDSVIEEEDENEDFDAAVAQAEARRASVHKLSRPSTSSLRLPSGRSRPLTGRSSLRPHTGSRSRPITASRSRPPTGGSGGSRGRPLTPLEMNVENALLKQVRSRPQTPVAPSGPAESDKKHKLGRDTTPPTSAQRPSTAARLLEKQKAAAAAVAAEKQRMGITDSAGDEAAKRKTEEFAAAERKKMEDAAAAERKKKEDAAAAERKRFEEQDLQTRREMSAIKLQSVLRGHRRRSWFGRQKRMFRLPGQWQTMSFEHKFPSSITWKLPRARGLAIDQGLWDTPWRMLQGADWRNPQKHTPDLTVLRHTEFGTVIELKLAPGSGKSFVFKETTVGNTPQNTPGNTPRHAGKVKICRDDAYVADWRFNAATLVKRMEAGEGSKIPCGPISFGCWHFQQTDPAAVCDDVFRKLDTDGSGAMEADEVYEAAQIMGFTDMSEEMVKTWIEEHDADGNGLIDSEEFKALIGVDQATRNMKITNGESTSELWLTSEGFIMLGHEDKNESIVCIRGKCLPYSVPKSAAWVHLGRADEALKRTEFAAKEAEKKAAAAEERRLAELAEEMARMKKENEKLAKIERRRQREAEADAKRNNPVASA